jgi:DNA mismatch repair protein MutH
MGSDVLYERDDSGVLPGFIERHAAAHGEVLIVDPNRGNRAAFTRRMRSQGYELDEALLTGPAVQAGGPIWRGRLLRYRR